MPATQIYLDDLNESLKRIINIRKRKHDFRVCHEAGVPISLQLRSQQPGLYFVIRSNIDRGSRMKVGRTTLLRSAPGLS